MLIVRSRGGAPVRLTDERWKHITVRHPEMKEQRDRVLETVSDPDLIQVGDSGELIAVRHYADTPLTEKYLVVPYKESPPDEGFVMTAYFTGQYSRRRTIQWKR